MECPLYLAYLLMGAISPDKTSLRLSDKDGCEYQVALAKKRAGHG